MDFYFLQSVQLNFTIDLYKMFSGINFLLKRTMSSFFNTIKNLLTAYHIDKSSTGKIIEPFFVVKYENTKILRW